MHPVCLLLCLCLLDHALSTSVKKIDERERKDPIGENVTVEAFIFYDSAYLDQIKQNTESNSIGSNSMKEYFEQLFQKVEAHFHNESVKISIKVNSVTLNNNFSTYSGGASKENDTLKNLAQYGHSLGLPPNAILYQFSWSNYKFMTHSPKSTAESQSAIETDGTFCTHDTSGAIILHQHKSLNDWSTLKATAFIFGSKHFTYFDIKDWRSMNETFLRCPKKGKNLDVPAC